MRGPLVAPPRRRLSAALCAGVCALALAAAATATADPTSRSPYVSELERICKPGSEATERAVKGVRDLVRSEHLRQAAPEVAKARRIFTHTVSRIAKVPRPQADSGTLARWFEALRRESRSLAETAAALHADSVARFQRGWGDFIHEGNKANNVVVSFGFNYCNFKPSRFE